MELREIILQSREKQHIAFIAKSIGSSQAQFNELFRFILSSDLTLAQRSSWIAGYVIQNHPLLIKQQEANLFKYLSSQNINHTIKRNLLRLLQFVDISKKYHVAAMDICFSIIQNPQEKVAAKAFSLTTLSKLCRIYPDIKPEIETIIRERWDYETMAFRSRAKHIIEIE